MRRRLRPTTWTALAFVAIGVALMVVDASTNLWNGWIPNLGASALEIAATILVVDRVVSRELARRNQPRVARVMSDLRYALRVYADNLAIDYVGTHVHNYKPIPKPIRDMFIRWIEESDTSDACTLVEGRKLSLVIDGGVELGETVRSLREHDREVMEPALVRAIDDYLWSGVGHGQLAASRRFANPDGVALSHRLGERLFVIAAADLLDVFLQHDRDSRPLEFDDLTVRAMAAHHQHALDRTGPIRR